MDNVLVFDIETVGVNEEDLTEEELEYLYRFANDEEEVEKTRQRFSLWAFTGHLVSWALYHPSKKTAVVYYISNRERKEKEIIGDISVIFKSVPLNKGIEIAEKRLLQIFWEIISGRKNTTLVSFNGRRFDGVFLMLRSMILGVRVSRDLVGKRYDPKNHIDILELISFSGLGRKYSLDFICRRMGIESPKTEMTGDEIKDYFEMGKYEEIARYNLRDVIATAELYKRLKTTLGDALEINSQGRNDFSK